MSGLTQKKVLITGGSGLLARNWALSIRDKYKTTLLLHHRKIFLPNVNMDTVSLHNSDECLQVLYKHQPDIVIHTAGLTDVEKCELNPDLAKEVNVDLAQNIAIACGKKKVKLIHISTDHLFSDEHSLATENSIPDPINNYAKTKLQGEQKALKNCKSTLVIRTNFFGWGTKYRHSFSDFILSHLKDGKTVNLFQDVFFTPILMDELVDKVHQLIDAGMSGVFNVVGDERLSKYEFAVRLANCFNLDASLINAVNINDKKNLVKRPKDMSLSNTKLRQTLDCKMLSMNEQFQILKKTQNNNAINLIQ